MFIENLSTFQIHKMKSQEQFERELAAGNIDENAIYLTPDSEASTEFGGEISNDYENNQAVSEYSFAKGSYTTAGLRGWAIEGYNEEDTVNTIDVYKDAKADVAVGDMLSFICNSNHWNIYTIAAIEDSYGGTCIRLTLSGTQDVSELDWYGSVE